jgi:PAS domain S-box-containing protein
MSHDFPASGHDRELPHADKPNGRRGEKPVQSNGKLGDNIINLIVERTSDLVAITSFSVSPKYVYLSPSHQRILGYDPADLMGRCAFDFMHPDDIRTLTMLLEGYVKSLAPDNDQSISLKLPTERMIYRFKAKAGDWHYLETTGDLLANDLIIFVSRDVTERVIAEEEILQSRMLLETQVQERTRELAEANEALRREIAEKQQKEDALRESEKRYRNILESIEDGYFEVDLSGTMTFFNASLCDITGYTSQELSGMNNRDYTEPETAKRMFEVFNRIYRTGEASKIDDYEVIKKDGSKCVMELSTSLMRDPSGEAVGFRGIARDVTEREKMKYQLEESEKKYRDIIQNMEEGYYEVDLKGNFAFFNGAMSKILGYSPEELMGMNNRQFMTEATAREVYRTFNEVYRTGNPQQAFDWEVIRKDGSICRLETSVSVVRDLRNNPSGFRGIARDVTERWFARKALEESEEKYRTILQSIEEGYYEVDVTGDMMFFNDSMCRILGYSPGELRGMNNRNFMTEETAKTVYETFNQVYRTGEPTKVFGWELVRKDGQRRYVETSVSPIKDQKGEPVGFRGMARDITEQRALEKARERMISHLAHELGTPISIITGTLRRISKANQEGDWSKVREWIERAQRNINRLRNLQDEIHDIFHDRPLEEKEKILHLVEGAVGLLEELEDEPLQEGTEAIRQSVVRRLKLLYQMEDIHSEKIPVGDFLDQVCGDATQSMSERQIEIIKNFESGISCEMDKKVLKKVCEGFLRNAVENTPDEGKVEVRLKSENNRARIEVQDFGIGITPENQHLIFSGFFHTQETHQYSTRKPYLFNAGGSGSDLLRAKILSERFNFSVGFSSERCKYLPTDTHECPGRISLCPFITKQEDCLSSGGSVFSVSLPLKS